MRHVPILVWVLSVVLAGGLGCQSDESKIAEHLGRAEAYQAEEQHREAIIEYRNVLVLDPKNVAAHHGLARSYLEVQSFGSAYWELRETVRLDPGSVEARLRLAQLASLRDELDEVLEQTQEILDAEPQDGDAKLRLKAQLLRGRAFDKQREHTQALEAYEKAVELAPNESEPLLVLANYHRRRGEGEEAERLFRRLIEVDPGFISYAALGGFLARDPSRYAEAEAAYRSAVDTATKGKRPIAISMLASFYYSHDHFEQAEETLRQAIAEQPDNLDMIYLLARFYLTRGEKRRADEVIESAIQARPDDLRPYLILSLYRSQIGDLERALDALNLAVNVDPESDAVQLRRAELLLDTRDQGGERVAEARNVVSKVLERDPSNTDALFVKGKVELVQGRTRDAILSLRRAVDLRSGWAQAHFLLGSALFIHGDHLAAREELTRALELDATLIDAHAILARVHSALGQHDFAVDEGRRVLNRRPGDVELRKLVAKSLASQRKVDEAILELGGVREGSRDAETLYMLGRLYTFKGEIVRARDFLDRADAAMPGNPEVLEMLLELDRRQQRLPDSITRIDQALQQDAANAALIHLRGRAAELIGHAAEAERWYRKAIELDPNGLRAYRSLGELLESSGRAAEALGAFEQALERSDLASLNFLVGSMHDKAGNRDKAIEYYERAIERDPTLVPAKNNLALLLADEGRDLDRALTLALEAKELVPNNPSTTDTLGWVLYKKGKASAAIGFLLEAESLAIDDPDIGLIRYHLALAYEANGEKALARTTIRRALDELEQGRRFASAAGTPEPDWAQDMRKLALRLRPAIVSPTRILR